MTLADYLSHVATVYLSHSHEPYSVTVREAYDTLKRELLAQYRMLLNGLTIEHTDSDPYLTSHAMFCDITNNRRLRVYTHADLPYRHPMSSHLPLKFTDLERYRNGLGNDRWLTYNDVFRAVHDGLAHYPGRHSFNPRGEFNAYRAHCTYLSPLARWAIATETLAQFAVYHYGPTPKTYAPQYATLLPRELVDPSIELEDI